MDGWTLQEKEGAENGKFITKRYTTPLKALDKEDIKFLVTFEYHIAYNLSYGVPVLCFKVWKQDGSLLSMEEYWALNKDLKDSNMYDTLTQLDHPVLCQPFLTLHPCRTQEIIQPFLGHSKNLVISWLSVVGPFVHLTLPDQYLKHC
ncbi:ubiquitin-like-conjugating enzyme ATG10 [Anoplophora glabripennis]|uniref:ubiquitin-like-conjugating enzyme ATG10 n=1 Tax=Anoplophora glabripennis TaxID=217634 RepID=UPI000C76B546|nr:ubiquitin-like-conjugating enzyme ATG10 [Anoplophora glabripennis]